MSFEDTAGGFSRLVGVGVAIYLMPDVIKDNWNNSYQHFLKDYSHETAYWSAWGVMGFFALLMVAGTAVALHALLMKLFSGGDKK